MTVAILATIAALTKRVVPPHSTITALQDRLADLTRPEPSQGDAQQGGKTEDLT